MEQLGDDIHMASTSAKHQTAKLSMGGKSMVLNSEPMLHMNNSSSCCQWDISANLSPHVYTCGNIQTATLSVCEKCLAVPVRRNVPCQTLLPCVCIWTYVFHVWNLGRLKCSSSEKFQADSIGTIFHMKDPCVSELTTLFLAAGKCRTVSLL